HLTDDSNDQLSVRERVEEADNFAREYLFSKEKIKKIRSYLYDLSYVKEYAAENNIHQRFIYVFNAFDLQKDNRKDWAWARKFSTIVENSIKSIDIPWDMPVEETLQVIKPNIYI